MKRRSIITRCASFYIYVNTYTSYFFSLGVVKSIKGQWERKGSAVAYYEKNVGKFRTRWAISGKS